MAGMVLRVRGRALPGGEAVDLYADGDRWTTDPVPGADLVAQGWLLPGLVDAHTHPGFEKPGDPLDDELLRADLREHARAGVTLIRSPGLAGWPPPWFGEDPDLPRAAWAGPWIAQPGQFYDGMGVRAAPADLPALAAQHAARSGWVKIIADWTAGPVVSAEVLADVVCRVHAAGGRVAVHSQQAEGGANAVAAGVDSLEHGMCLDPELLHRMAAQGTALIPTLSVIEDGLRRALDRPAGPLRDWYIGGASVHGALAAAAAEAGVRVLAGTDSRPHGRIGDEVRALAAAGVPVHDALGAASWVAREYLGLAGLTEGSPADAVVYASDPRDDLRQLDHPVAVILRGTLLRPVR
jgi:imidazolonepropionase-like amidohydrolase